MCVIVLLVEFCRFCLKLVILQADVFSSEIGMFQLNEWHCFVSNSGQKKSTKNLEKMDFKKEAITQLYMRLLFDNSKTNTAVRIPYILYIYL